MRGPSPALLVVLLAGCGDSGVVTTGLADGVMFANPDPSNDDDDDDDGSPPSSDGAPTDAGAATDALTGTDPAPTTNGPTTEGVTLGTESTATSTTDSSMSEVSTLDSTDTTAEATGATTQPCLCEPGAVAGCDQDGQVLVCEADCLGFAPEACPQGQKCSDGACAVQAACTPNSKQCADDDHYEQCKADGSGYGSPVACPANEGCAAGSCVGLCAAAESSPRSLGCSFLAARQDNDDNLIDGSLVVSNPSKTTTAKVQLYFTATGGNVEQAQGAAKNVLPGQSVEFKLTNAPLHLVSAVRAGGVYRVTSTIPVMAAQHSPFAASPTNDSSLLLPEHALGKDYVIASYVDSVVEEDMPSYFQVVATKNSTLTQWTPPVATSAGSGVNAIAAGQTGNALLKRFDTLQVRAPDTSDVSGTLVQADNPVWVVGAVNCSNVPADGKYCDHLQEVMLPVEHWGKTYVGAASPKRGSESHHWRIYGGENGTVVTATPAVPGTPVMVNKGQWKDLKLANGTSTVFTSTKKFLPVQYLEGGATNPGGGDPSMYQMIPVDQFLDRYAFAIGTGFTKNYVQIVRTKNGPDVAVDGVTVTGYAAIGAYEVANWSITEGNHFAESEGPFGATYIGYMATSSYAYPGGFKR